MNRAACILVLGAALGGCSKPVPAPVAPTVPPVAAPATPASAVAERLVFVSTDWSGGRGQCTDNTAAEGCDSEWRHTQTQQLVRVFFVEVKEEAALPRFVDKLSADVIARGGIAERIEQAGMVVVRFLEQAQQPVDGGVLEVASLNYALVGRDKKAVHLITSVVPFDDQQPSDARLRALLTTAAWATVP